MLLGRPLRKENNPNLWTWIMVRKWKGLKYHDHCGIVSKIQQKHAGNILYIFTYLNTLTWAMRSLTTRVQVSMHWKLRPLSAHSLLISFCVFKKHWFQSIFLFSTLTWKFKIQCFENMMAFNRKLLGTDLSQFSVYWISDSGSFGELVANATWADLNLPSFLSQYLFSLLSRYSDNTHSF